MPQGLLPPLSVRPPDRPSPRDWAPGPRGPYYRVGAARLHNGIAHGFHVPAGDDPDLSGARSGGAILAGGPVMLPRAACRHVASPVTLALATRSVPIGAVFLPYRPLVDRHRDPSGGQVGATASDRPWNGGRGWRNRRNRRRLLPVSSGHPGRRTHQRWQAAPHSWQ